MGGWVKIHRQILNNPIICKDAETFAIWLYLLLNATHQEYDVLFKGKRITLNKGQLITGRKTIASDLNISESKVQRTLKMFEIEHQIEQQTSSKNRLVSIVNWNKYQENEQQNKQQVNNNRTTSEQQVNTNKNIKNIKNDKNINKKESKKEKNTVPTFDDLINAYTTDKALQEELRNHLAVRKSKRGAMTNRALELSFQKLDKLTSSFTGNDKEIAKIAIVQQSIENGWVGFFELKDTTFKGSTKTNLSQYEIVNTDGLTSEEYSQLMAERRQKNV